MWKIFKQFIIIFLLLSCAHANISIRTSLIKNNECFIAIDFPVKQGEHITAPVADGKSMAPIIKLKNAQIKQFYWPKAEPIKDHTKLYGFYKDFTLVCKVKVLKLPIKYDIFYVSCGKACTPHQITGEIKINNLIKKEEVNKECFSLIKIILFGFLGGLLLNIMPCVLPIISIKLLSIIKQSLLPINTIRKHCILYSLGTISFFLFLGLFITKFHVSKPEIGWGFYMQNPTIVFSLLLIFLFCSLHFLSIYQIHFPFPIMRSGSFINGAFSAISSAICIGPFLGVVIGAAILNNEILLSVILFFSIGIGLAFPFLLFAIFPGKIKKIPKLSSNWSKVLTLILGTCTLITCSWLLLVLSRQINNILFIFSLIIIISVLLYSSSIFTNYKIILKVLSCVCIICGYFILHSSKGINWVDYQKEYLLQSNTKPVFINFTADWCLNCKVNERVFNNEKIINLFETKNIIPIKCDLTLRNNQFSELLQSYGTVSVPFYVIYSSDKKKYNILPSILTLENLKQALDCI